MKYLDRLRAAGTAQNVFVGDRPPPKPTEPPQGLIDPLTKPPEPGSVSFASAAPLSKTLAVTGDSDRERRIERATRMLRESPNQRASFITGDESDGLIPVTVAIRTREGLTTGDLVVPKDRWDPWLFLQFLREQPQGTGS